MRDKAVVPLLYEGRHVEADIADQVDRWFEREVAKLPEAKARELKKGTAKMRFIRTSEPWLREVAVDVADDFKANWRGTPFKAQLVAETQAAAVRLYRLLKDEGIQSAVIISEGDDREGHEAVNCDPDGMFEAHWKEVRDTWGNAQTYEERTIEAFKGPNGPEVLVVVAKLLTGFDAPRNRVLYLARSLVEHNLLQAIARVNRLFDVDDKEGGQSWSKEDGRIIDYVGLLGDLDDALTTYSAFDGFDESDLNEALVALRRDVEELPRLRDDVRQIFKGVNAFDREAYEQALADDGIRDEFYTKLRSFAQVLATAFSSRDWLAETPSNEVQSYKDDLKRFESLRRSVIRRYADAFDSRERREYEARIRKLLDRHVTTDGLSTIVEPVDIFDDDAFQRTLEEQDETSTAAKADAIAHATQRAISVRMDEDEVLYRGFADLVRDAMKEFKDGRIDAAQYLKKVTAARNAVVNRQGSDNVPDVVRGSEFASALWRSVRPLLEPFANGGAEEIAAESAQAFANIVASHKRIGWQDDPDVEKAIRNDIDDFLFDEVRGTQGLTELDGPAMDEIIRASLEIARRHEAQ